MALKETWKIDLESPDNHRKDCCEFMMLYMSLLKL